jgi:hypothetical protein
VNQPNLVATVAPILAAEAIHAYEQGGSQGFARFSRSHVYEEERQLYLLDESYRDVLKRHISDDGLRVPRATKGGRLTLLRNHIAGYRALSASGTSMSSCSTSTRASSKRETELLGTQCSFCLFSRLLLFCASG